MPANTEKIKKTLRSKKEPPVVNDVGLSTGSTILNLGFSGKASYGYLKGLMYSFVGDSSSGKSILALSALAEASVSPHFKNYKLEFADKEGGALMDMETYFGAKAASKINPWTPDTLEDFYDRADDLVKAGDPFVLVLDSMDALWPESQEQKAKEDAAARRKGKEVGGSYNTDKAKINSSRLRVLTNGVKETKSIFIVISQTRANIGFGSQFNPKTYSGGEAIKFYSRIQLWTSIRENLVTGKYKTQYGILSQVKVTKNHICGWQGKLEVPILRGYGIDDIGACVNFLVTTGKFRATKGKDDRKVTNIVAEDFDFEGSPEKLVQKIEKENLESELRLTVSEVWKEIEESAKAIRKPRYV